MTKDEADERVREAEAKVLRIARRWWNSGLSRQATSVEIDEAVAELNRAEAARAALDKPELLRPEAVFVEADGKYWCVPELVRADRRHILAQAEKLPRYGIDVQPPDPNCGTRQAILLSDLRNLIEGR
jgi:hypothetical protein